LLNHITPAAIALGVIITYAMTYINDSCYSRQPPPVLDDIQGLVLRGYTLPYIRYVVFQMTDLGGAKSFLSKLLPGASEIEITTAKPWDRSNRPVYCLNIGLTYSGMDFLMSDEDRIVVERGSSNVFSLFKQGAVSHAKRVGDIKSSDPEHWWKRSAEWLLPTPRKSPYNELHILVSIYADSADTRENYHQKLLNLIPVLNGSPALLQAYIQDSDPLNEGDDYIHFGYKDSFSQPRLSDVPWNTNVGRLLAGKGLIDDRPCVPPYQFVITPKFKVDPTNPKSPEAPYYRAHPLLYNGSFAAFRVLHQDVKAFKAFINKDKEKGISPGLVAAKMCGRWFDGTPLVISPNGPDKTLNGYDYTNFNYLKPTAHQQGKPVNDEFGLLCPYASHIRRTNPRDDYKVQGNGNKDGTAKNAEDKRIMRRAGPYGPDYDEAKPDDKPRGLVGLFICANLDAQFSFIMGSWVVNGNFRRGTGADISPNKSGIDPLFGNNDEKIDQHKSFAFLPPGSRKEPKTEDYTILNGLPQFIRTDGGLYVFLPGIDGLRHLANGTIPKP
jgi:deferrochelatase/peroxidase EfeB